MKNDSIFTYCYCALHIVYYHNPLNYIDLHVCVVSPKMAAGWMVYQTRIHQSPQSNKHFIPDRGVTYNGIVW